MATDSRPDAPGHLSARASGLWRSIVERYELEDEELATLTLALESLDVADTARRRLKRDGQYVEDRFEQLKPHPAVQVHRDALASWARLTALLGIPSDPTEDRPDRDSHGRFSRGSFNRKAK